jgi:predicted GNAT family acetyltransferase
MSVYIPQDSLASMCQRLSELSSGSIKENAGYMSYESGRSMFYDRYLITAHHDQDAAAIVDFICKDIQNGGARMVSYTEEISGRGFDDELSRRGFQNVISQTGMYIVLDDDAPVRPNDPAIALIGGTELEEWSRACEIGFGKPSELPALQVLIKDDDCRFYAYKIDGRIVGTALTYAQDGNCGIHEVTTLPEYRGRGICSSLVARIVDDARQDGEQIVSLQASAAGTPVYARAGLKAVSTMKAWILFGAVKG